MSRRVLWLSLCTAVLSIFVPPVMAQELSGQQTAALDSVTIWKLANTAIFAAGLGWALWKFAPGFFNARSADIQKAIKDATGLKIDADFRYSEIDKKMANLPAEKARLEREAAAEMEREHAKIQRETEAELEHIRRNVQAEVDGLRQEGAQRIQRHTAQLALQLAERRLQQQFSGGEPQNLLQDFIQLVERGEN